MVNASDSRERALSSVNRPLYPVAGTLSIHFTPSPNLIMKAMLNDPARAGFSIPAYRLSSIVEVTLA